MDRASGPWLRAHGRSRRSSGSSRFFFQSIRSASQSKTFGLFELNFDIHARGEIELAQRVDSLLGRLEHVEQALMSTNLKMLARLLVDMRRAINRKSFDPGRERNRTGDAAAGAPDSIHDFSHRLIEQAVVVRLEAYAYLVVHLKITARPIFSGPRSHRPIDP